MTDIFNKNTRSSIMKCVKSRNNASTELKLIDFFKKYNVKGWKRNYKIKGKPDFVFLKHKIAIFTDGCFWHGHNCRNTKPEDNKIYWTAKIKRNIERDKEITEYLKTLGWKVIRIWECELRIKNTDKLLEKISILLVHNN